MRTITLSELRTEIRNRGDYQDTDLVTDVELTSYINSSITELYDLLVSKYGDEYYLKDYSFNLVANQSQYNLPADFLKVKGIDLVIDSSKSINVQSFEFRERNIFTSINFNNPYNIRYRVMGDKLMFMPPKNNMTNQIVLWYVPACAKLVNNSDTLDGVNGWEEYVIVDVIRKIKIKVEESIQEILVEKNALIARIEYAASNRDSANAQGASLVRNRTRNGWWDDDTGDN